MIRRKLVDGLIVLTAFVLFSTVGEALAPRFAFALAHNFCDPTLNVCPRLVPGCVGCTKSPSMTGSCSYSYLSSCTLTPAYCWLGAAACSCNPNACS